MVPRPLPQWNVASVEDLEKGLEGESVQAANDQG